MTARPSEVRAFVEILSQEHDDLETLSKLLIGTLEELRAERDVFTLATKPFPGRRAVLYGPFSTRGQAERHTRKLVAPQAEGMEWDVFTIHPPTAQ